MHEKKIIEWLRPLKSDILKFLEQLNENNFFHYSLTGDLYSSDNKWGLGNAVFAAKIYYMLGDMDTDRSEKIAKFIKSFQNDQGYIHDPLVEQKSKLRRYVNAFRSKNFANFFNEQTRRAETRQSFAALICLNDKPHKPFLKIPYTKNQITKYIEKLNWSQPWGACSHISHLLFFLKQNNALFNIHQDDTHNLITYVIGSVNDMYRQSDGSWYPPSSNIPHYEKVNAAMKMMTAFDAVSWYDFDKEKELIDLCLLAINEGHACNHFNVICVLYHCSRKTDYKKNEIRQYCLNQLSHYRQYYWPDSGGFSFFKGKANHNYYGAIISRGLKEPDIHGTVLFLWGISLIVKMLEYDHLIQLNAPIT